MNENIIIIIFSNWLKNLKWNNIGVSHDSRASGKTPTMWITCNYIFCPLGFSNPHVINNFRLLCDNWFDNAQFHFKVIVCQYLKKQAV